MMRTIIIAMMCCALLAACGSGHKMKQTVLTRDNLVEVQKKITEGKVLNKKEQQWYILGQIKISSSGQQVIGRTVGQVIDAGRTASDPHT
jgi:hypothetical protein